MSFGFSPSDIVLFTKLPKKIVSSLKENGSRLEFQQAEEQCQAFISLIEEIKNLNLSVVPESFRSKLSEHSAKMQRLIQEFKKSIGQYENSMGKRSSRGWFLSAPRKIQWMLLAAEDLKAFRQSLQSYVDLIKLTIQTSILAKLDNRLHSPLPSRPTSHNLLRNDRAFHSTYTAPYRLDKAPTFLSGYELLRQVDDLKDIVYNRLLMRPSIQNSGRINTLPDDSIAALHSLPTNSIQEHETQSTSSAHELQSAGDQELIERQVGADHHDRQSLADDIDEYLVQLNLDRLSSAEREYVKQNDQLHLHNLPPGAGKRSTGTGITGHDSSEELHFRNDAKTPRFPRLDPLSAAATVIRVYGYAAEMSLTLTNIFCDMSGAFNEVRAISKKLRQYSMLLHSASAVVPTLMFCEELRELGSSLLYENEMLMNELEGLISSHSLKSTFPLARWFKWHVGRKDISNLVDQIDSLQTSLSIVLQLYQAKMTENQIQIYRQPLRNVYQV